MKVSNETKVGVLGAISITLLILGYNFLKGKELFYTPTEYYSVYEHINGLAENNPVQINGLKVGHVGKLSLLSDTLSRILATFYIKEGVRIPRNSVARIISSDILGARAVEIVLGNDENLLQNKDTLRSEIELSLMESVNQQVLPVKKKAEDLLSSIDSMVTMIKYIFNENARENIESSFESINKSLLVFQSASVKLETLVTEEKERLDRIFIHIESISHNLKSQNEKIANIIENTSAITDSIVQAELMTTINKASIAFSQASDVIERVNNGEGSLGLLLKDENLYNNLSQSAGDLDKLLQDINDNPNKYVHFSVFGKKQKKEKEKEEKKMENQ